MSKKNYRVVMDTWLMGQPVRAGDTQLTDAQVEQGLAGGTVEEVTYAAEVPSPNGITEPVKHPVHQSITKDSVADIKGAVTGDTETSLVEAEADAKAKKK